MEEKPNEQDPSKGKHQASKDITKKTWRQITEEGDVSKTRAQNASEASLSEPSWEECYVSYPVRLSEAFKYIQNFTPVMVTLCSWWLINFTINFQHTKEKLKMYHQGDFRGSNMGPPARVG